jgi:hypothetical protein
MQPFLFKFTEPPAQEAPKSTFQIVQLDIEQKKVIGEHRFPGSTLKTLLN